MKYYELIYKILRFIATGPRHAVRIVYKYIIKFPFSILAMAYRNGSYNDFKNDLELYKHRFEWYCNKYSLH